jgi:elongation factor P
MAIQANEIRKGMVILFEGAPCRVMEFHHHTPGNLRAMVQTRLRNLISGNSFDHRFRSGESLEIVILEEHEMEYLYSDASLHHFMNTENYEQVTLSRDDVGDIEQWFVPGLKISVKLYNGRPIGVELPSSLELTVVETEPQLKGATATNLNKPAKLENGVTIQVPPFIAAGERIRVNPNESRYIERAK